MDMASQIIDAVETPARTRRAGGDMRAVVGKLLARSEPRGLADDFIAFNHELAAVGVGDDPLSAQ